MSLQVWLPLNGNISNQGISPLTPVQSTAPTYVSGKTGKAMSTGAMYLPAAEVAKFYNNNAMSFCFWIYPTASGSTAIPIIGQSAMAAGDNRMFTIYHYSTTADIHLSWQNETASGTFLNVVWSNVLTVAAWNHVAITYNGSTAILYVNGVQKGTASGTSARTNFAYNVPIPSSTQRYLCDLRIYNHVLSLKEIKEIAKGLVIHYTLNDRSIQTMANCFAYPTFDTSASGGGWSHWGGTGHIGSFGQNTNAQYIFRQGQTYSHWFANGAGATYNYLCYQSPAFSGGYRSLCAIIKEENSLPITNSIVYPTWNARSGGTTLNQWTSVKHLRDGFYLCRCEGIMQDGSNNLVGLYVTAGHKVFVSECYLENDRTCCSDMFFNYTTVHDSSGFQNNGIKVNDLTVSPDSPRYNISTLFGTGKGVYSTLYPVQKTDGDPLTVSCWFKQTNRTDYQYLIANRDNSYCNWMLYTHTTDGSIQFHGKEQYKSSIIPTLNVWHHVVAVVYENKTYSLFLDGVKVVNAISYLYQTQTPSNLCIGKYGTTTTCHQPFIGYLSDVRIYNTALSDDDIKELYNSAASINKDGSVFCYELVEG